MTDQPRHPDTDDHAGAGHEPSTATGAPWGVYAVVFIAVVLVLGVVVLHLAGVVGPGAH